MALWPNKRKEQENLEEVCVGGVPLLARAMG